MSKKKTTMLQSHGIAGLFGLVDPELAHKMMFGDGSNRVTGQVVTMATGQKTKDGREIFSVFGLIAVPSNALKDLHKYPLAGQVTGFPQTDKASIHIGLSEGEDNFEKMKGMGIAGIMTSEQWRL